MSAPFEKLGTAAVIVAALLVSASSLRREFRPSSTTRNGPGPETPTFQTGWKTFAQSGALLGDAAAPVQIVEFADFECPFCANFERSYEALHQKLGKDIALVFIHFPLTGHRFARPAARVAECANDQGRFAEMHSALFAGQDSLGLKSWESFASDAKVPDIARFLKCAADTTTPPRVKAGLALGGKLRIRGTPTVLINGWRYWGLQPDSLEAEVKLRRETTKGR